MNVLTGLRAVSFDVGGTLIEPWPSVGHVYAETALEAGLPAFDPVLLNERFRTAWRQKRHFDYSRKAWADLVVETFDGPVLQFGESSRCFGQIYDRFTQAKAWKIHHDVIPAFEALSRRGFKLAVVSNWDLRLRPLLQNLRLDRFFDAIEVSAESGFHKPAPEIFRRMLVRLGLGAGEVLHVGDSLAEDLEGARSAGLRRVLLRRDAKAQGPEEIGSLSELVSE
jgi:putative hydrolase of the HAD superfamily